MATDIPTAPSGLRVRHIKTTTVTVDGVVTIVPALDRDGREIELSSIEIPQHIESDCADAIETHVLEQLTAPDPAVPLVDVDVAENAPTFDEGGE